MIKKEEGWGSEVGERHQKSKGVEGWKGGKSVIRPRVLIVSTSLVTSTTEIETSLKEVVCRVVSRAGVLYSLRHQVPRGRPWGRVTSVRNVRQGSLLLVVHQGGTPLSFLTGFSGPVVLKSEKGRICSTHSSIMELKGY